MRPEPSPALDSPSRTGSDPVLSGQVTTHQVTTTGLDTSDPRRTTQFAPTNPLMAGRI
jgi:hypothetical protein